MTTQLDFVLRDLACPVLRQPLRYIETLARGTNVPLGNTSPSSRRFT